MEHKLGVFLCFCFLSGALGSNTVGFPTQSEIFNIQGDDDPIEDNAQWLFPNVRFTCNGTITAWIFHGRSSCRSSDNNCTLYFEIWQPDSENPDLFTFVNSTAITEPEESEEREDIYQQVLNPPIAVKENDTLGILQPENGCRISVLDLSNTESLNPPVAYFSFITDVVDPTLSLGSFTSTREYIPLITPVISVLAGNPVQITSTVTQSLLRGPTSDPTLSPSPDPQNPDTSDEAESKLLLTVVGISTGAGVFLAIVVIFTCATILTFKVKSRKALVANHSAMSVRGQTNEQQVESITSPVTEEFVIDTNEAYGTPHVILRPKATGQESDNEADEKVSVIYNEAYLQAEQADVMDSWLYVKSEPIYDYPQL